MKTLGDDMDFIYGESKQSCNVLFLIIIIREAGCTAAVVFLSLLVYFEAAFGLQRYTNYCWTFLSGDKLDRDQHSAFFSGNKSSLRSLSTHF